MKFSFLDVFLLLGLGLAMFMGYRGGFTKKILTLLALIGAIVVSVKLMRPIGEFLLEPGILSEPLCYVVAFTIVMLAIMGLVIFLYHRYGKSSSSKSAASALGVLFGLVEGILILSLLLIALKVFDAPSSDVQKDSILYRPILRAAPKTFEVLKPYLPGAAEFRTEISKAFKDLNLNGVLPDPGKK